MIGVLLLIGGMQGQTLLADSTDAEVQEPGCEVWAPNSFTPDFDGLNDAWRPVVGCELEEYEVRIFDRWGTLVFQTTDPKRWWNGQTENEQLGTGKRFSPDGHYSFLITYRKPDSTVRVMIRKTGHIWLAR
jgi:gliding motility-associated-like protein